MNRTPRANLEADVIEWRDRYEKAHVALQIVKRERDNIDRDYREHTETLGQRWEQAARQRDALHEECDAAQAEVARLTTDRQRMWDHDAKVKAVLQAEIMALRAEIARLRTALEEFRSALVGLEYHWTGSTFTSLIDRVDAVLGRPR